MSSALVFIDYTTKGSRWVSSNDPLPVTFGGSGGVAGLVQVAGVNGTAVATDANYFPVGQTTASRLNAQVVGNVASDAVDSGPPVKIGGRAVPTTVRAAFGAAADRVDAAYDLYGNAYVGLTAVNATALDGVSNGANICYVGNPAQPSFAQLLGIAPWIFNGTSWDRDRKPNVSKRIASSAASGNPDFLKASAGDLTKFWGLNGAAITYVQIYNKASAPTIGTDTPILTYPVAANAAFDVSIPNGGLYFSTGIAYAFTTDAAGTTGAGAAAVTACNIIGA